MLDNGITIQLSKAQINQVLREAVEGDGLPGLLGSALKDREIHLSGANMDDTRFSRSLLRALMVLACYPADGSARSVSDIARQLGMGISTIHRYTSTFAEVGVLERDPVSRQYRLASNAAGSVAAE